MAATGVDIGHDPSLRRKSVSAIEIQDQSGRRRTIQLEELSEADQKLAAEFGYKPVRVFPRYPRHVLSFPQSGLLTTLFRLVGVQERIRLLVDFLLRCQYLWAVFDSRHYLLIPAVCRWICVRSLVLVDFWSGMHVHCCEYSRCLDLKNFQWLIASCSVPLRRLFLPILPAGACTCLKYFIFDQFTRTKTRLATTLYLGLRQSDGFHQSVGSFS